MYRSYAFTVRPKLGVPPDSELERSLIKYIKKYQGFLVAEKEHEERHIHGQIFFEDPKPKGRFNEALESMCEKHLSDWSSPQKRVLRGGTKIAYSDEFFTEYTNKGGDLLVESMPQDTNQYYPSQEEQDAVRRRVLAADAKYHHLSEMFREYYKNDAPAELADIRKFLYDIMFVKKQYHVIEDPKKRTWTCKALLEYVREDINRWNIELETQKKISLGNIYAELEKRSARPTTTTQKAQAHHEGCSEAD